MNRSNESPGRVDYDQLAPSYDRRFETNELDGVLTAVRGVAQDVRAERILEVGCGTGRWLADLASERIQRWGLDPSSGMLREARKRNGDLRLVKGRAERAPLADAAFDLVFCINAIHHFDDPRAFVREAHRLLRAGGALAVLGSNPHGRQSDWYVYAFFEGTYETDLRRFPTWETLGRWMAASGFLQAAQQEVERVVDHKVGRRVLEDPFLEKQACSQLALLTDEAYAAGMGRIRAALARAEAAGQWLTFPTDIQLAMMVARKGEGSTAARERMA